MGTVECAACRSGAVLAMPTKKGGYWTADRSRRLPSVTTVIGVGLGGYSKDALLQWAWKEGKEGRDYRQTRDRAASVGTLAHALIENHLNGIEHTVDWWKQFDQDQTAMDMLIGDAENAYTAFIEWFNGHHVALIEQEVSLSNDTLGYGGTFDALIDLDGVRTLADWKSSSGIYGSYVAQIGGYYQLITAEYDQEVWPEQAVIVRVGKDGSLREVMLNRAQMIAGRKLFNHALAVYGMRADVDAMVAPPSDRIGVETGVRLSGKNATA